MDGPTDTQRKRPYRSQRIDYYALNGDIDEEALLEDRIIEDPSSRRICSSVEPISPEDSPSQLTSIQSPNTEEMSSDIVSVTNRPGLSPRRTMNQTRWAQFNSSPLPGKMWWPKRIKSPIENREVHCKRCNWKPTDSAIATSTSNMIFHLSKHGIFLSGPQISSSYLTTPSFGRKF